MVLAMIRCLMMAVEWSKSPREGRRRGMDLVGKWRRLELGWRRVGEPPSRMMMGGQGGQKGEQISVVEVGTHLGRCDPYHISRVIMLIAI